jgi:amino acid transporter
VSEPSGAAGTTGLATGPSTPPSVRPSSAPRRRLSLFDVLCIGVNATVGSGVFALPDDMQRAMGGWSPLAYLLCSILLLPVALCFAELAGRFDETGGAYVYARHAFGKHVGFIIGWYCWANTFVAWAANTTLFVELCGVPPSIGKPLCVAVIVALGAVNYFGVKPGAWIVNLMVIGKITAILCFVAVAIFRVELSRLGGPLPVGIAGVGQGIYLALFPLQGFEVTPVTAGETDNPKRNVPLGTMGALLFSALLFIVVQTVLVGSYAGLAQKAQTPLVDAAFSIGGVIGTLVLVGSLVSIGGFTAGSALGSPRYAKAIADHRLMPSVMAKVHARWGTPHVAIGVTTALTAVLAFFFDYRRLVGMSNITVCIQYLATCLALPVIRRRATAPSTGFVVPFGDVVAGVGALGSIALFAASDRTEFAFALITLAVGVALAFASSRSGPATAG